MNYLEWAKREVELATEKEKGLDIDGDFEYANGIYNSALKALEALLEDGHSGFSIGITMNVLNRLVDGKPLTTIHDVPEIWVLCEVMNEKYGNISKPVYKQYQCNRCTSLFKYEFVDGTVKYSDVDRTIGINIKNPNCTYSSGLIKNIINEMFPITMPYYPGKPYKVYTEDFLSDKANGDYDTMGVFYAIDPEGNRIEINRYFHYVNGKDRIEISKDDYLKLKKRSLNL